MIRQAFAFALAAAAASPAIAAELTIGSTTQVPGQTAVVPVTIINDSDALSLVTFQVTLPPELAAVSAAPGIDQSNLAGTDVFVDDLGGGTYRVTAFVLSTPDMAAGAGNTINLEFDLTGVAEATYPISITATEFYDTSNAQETVTATTDGSVTVDAAASVPDWAVLDY